jgi:uncharacterized protein with GYD domain
MMRRFEGGAPERRGGDMATFITLAKYTQQGIQSVKDSPKRLDAYKSAAQRAGATVRGFYLTMGRYDIVVVVEAPDDETAARLALATGALGNVSTETLRAFNEDEFRKLVASLP